MRKKIKIKDEKGSILIYSVTITLCFLSILGGLFFVNSSLRKNQVRTLTKITEVYNSQLSKAEEIIKNRKIRDFSGYVNDSRILFLDGINNSGTYHNNNAKCWKDINGDIKTNELADLSRWRDNSLRFDGNEIALKSVDLLSNNYTVEVVFSLSELSNENIICQTDKFIVGVNNEKNLYFYSKDLGKRYYTTLDIELEKRYTFTTTIKDSKVNVYINGSIVDCKNVSEINTNNSKFMGREFYGNIFSIRIYTRNLNEKEIVNNYSLDKFRYDIYEIEKTIESISWKEIAQIAHDISNDPNIYNRTKSVEKRGIRLNVGDTKQLIYNGEYKQVRIIGFNHDELAIDDSSIIATHDVIDRKGNVVQGKTAGITFEFTEFMTGNNWKQMNSYNSNSGGWKSSELRTFLEGTDGIDLLSNEKYIKTVKKRYLPTYDNEIVEISNDRLWLLSCSEIWSQKNEGNNGKYGEAKGLEGIQYKWYMDNENFVNPRYSNLKFSKRIRNENSTSAFDWWLRSPLYSDNLCFCVVSKDGSCTGYNASDLIGIAPGFAI